MKIPLMRKLRLTCPDVIPAVMSRTGFVSVISISVLIISAFVGTFEIMRITIFNNVSAVINVAISVFVSIAITSVIVVCYNRAIMSAKCSFPARVPSDNEFAG